MEESADYILRPIRWPTDAGHERDGWEIVLLPSQVLEVSLDLSSRTALTPWANDA
jgi:hypothetical protein